QPHFEFSVESEPSLCHCWLAQQCLPQQIQNRKSQISSLRVPLALPVPLRCHCWLAQQCSPPIQNSKSTIQNQPPSCATGFASAAPAPTAGLPSSAFLGSTTSPSAAPLRET